MEQDGVDPTQVFTNRSFADVMIGGVTLSQHPSKVPAPIAARILLAAVVLPVIAISAACGGTPPASRRPHDVLIVTLDTARADRFSYLGNSPVTTTATDRVAAEGAAFTNGVAPSPITLVSHASLFTGRNPFAHGVRNNGDFALGSEAVTLAEALSDRGWATAAFVGATVLDSRYGLDQGFGHYDDEISITDAAGMFTYPRRRGDEVVTAALRWLEAIDQKAATFVWVHLYDPHAPYDPPEPERSRYANPYDGTVAYADRMVGELLAGYRRLQRYEKTLVVVTSDHGESLGEHGEATHGVFVYDATVRVPLVVRGPGVSPGTIVAEPVALIDVMPTVLGLTGVPVSGPLDGRDLRPLLAGESSADGDRAIYVESLLPQLNYGWSPLQGLRTERWKFIRGTEPELYDLDEDPAELRDQARDLATVAAEMSSRLASVLENGSSTTARRLEVDEAERSRLEALGYVSMVDDPEPANDLQNLPDPRQRIAVMEKMYNAMTRFADGDPGAAIGDLEEILAGEPDNFSVWASLAEMYFRLGNYQGAADAWGRAARLAPRIPRYAEFEGLALERLGMLEEALDACDRALAIDPDRSSSREFKWRLLSRLDRKSELVPELEAVVAVDPGNGMARLLLIKAIHGRAPSPDLVAALEEALVDLPGDLALTAGLAGAVYGTGDEGRADDLYRRVLAQRPGDYSASLVVGERALEAGRIEEARRILEAGARKNPDRAAMQVMVARARMADGDFENAREALVRAYQLEPGWARTWLAAGELGILEGLPEQAAANLDRAAAAAGDDQDLWRRLATAYRRLGREEDAADAERRAHR